MSQASIVIENLTKRYPGSDRNALDKISLSVNQGEVYGFLGPNGAGKSTTIRLLMNFIKPTAGGATILGHDIVADSVEIKRHVGYLSSDLPMYPKMTGKQFLAYMDELQPAKNQTYINELSKRLRAETHKKLGELSRGNRQKIGIIQAFMHQPNIMILDEPTSGLDPLMQEVFYELIDEAKQRGASIFVSSHILSEVQKMCDRVGIIRGGQLITERDIAEMAHEAAQTFEIEFSSKAPTTQLRRIKGAKIVDSDDNKVTIHIHGNLSPFFGELSKHNVVKMDARNLDLEEVFLRFYQDKEPKK